MFLAITKDAFSGHWELFEESRGNLRCNDGTSSTALHSNYTLCDIIKVFGHNFDWRVLLFQLEEKAN